MNEQHRKNVIEAALLAAGRPLSLAELAGLFPEGEQPEPAAIGATLAELAADYADRGIELREVASGYRVQVRDTCAAPVSRLWQERPPRYSRALLETLALVAYRQPITRGEIETVRGVAVNPHIIRTLTERGWIRVVGHREVPGRPELLGTTREFLDYFSLKSLDALPTLAELRDLESLGVQLEFPDAAGLPGAGALPDSGDDDSPELDAESARGDAPELAELAELHAAPEPPGDR
jgi:segregation and condensation protein B